MIYPSQNELKSVFYRMLVGAKFDVGAAEDMAKAGAFGAALGLPVYTAMLEGLTLDSTDSQIDEGQFQSAGPADFRWMLQALDLLQAHVVSHCQAPAGPVNWLAIPLLAGMAPELSLSVRVQEAMYHLSDGQVYPVVSGRGAAGAADLSIATIKTITPEAPPLALGPISVDEDLWAQLDELASHSYVPATEASRLSGAGAGLSDND